MGAAPLSQPEVLRTTDVMVGDAPQVADHQGADPLFDHEGNHLLGRLMMALMDPTTVTGVQLTLPRSVSAPAARASLPALRCSAGCSELASLSIAQVQIIVGADGAPRDQQSGILSHDRVWMDDAKIDPGYMLRVEIELLYGDRGGNVKAQPSVMHQCDRSDLLHCIGKWTGQPNPQRRMARGDRQAHPSSVDLEGAAIESDRHETALASRETRTLPAFAAFSRGEPGIGVPLNDGASPRDGQLAKASPRG
jgi:hypothetical protein